jgi:hypothetical protein
VEVVQQLKILVQRFVETEKDLTLSQLTETMEIIYQEMVDLTGEQKRLDGHAQEALLPPQTLVVKFEGMASALIFLHLTVTMGEPQLETAEITTELWRLAGHEAVDQQQFQILALRFVETEKDLTLSQLTETMETPPLEMDELTVEPLKQDGADQAEQLQLLILEAKFVEMAFALTL